MESSTTPDNPDRVARALGSRLAHLVLPDSGGLDGRDALVLSSHGIITRHTSEEDDGDVERLRVAVSPPEGSTLGPMLFYTNREGKASAACVRDVLVHDRADMRETALRYLESNVASGRLLVGRSADAVREFGPEICLDDPAAWRPAAIRLADVLDDDWLFNVAGVAQCVAPGMEESWSDYLGRALRPSIASLNAAVPRMLCPELHAEEFAEWSRSFSASCRADPDSFDQYLAVAGHAPLSHECALSKMVLNLAGGEQVRPVLDWAGYSHSPVALYHACEACLRSNEEFTPSELARISSWFWEIVCRPSAEDEATLNQSRLELCARLAQYYVYYMELRLPSDHRDAIAAMAWWMTWRLDQALSMGQGNARYLREQLDDIYATNAQDLWDLMGPAMAPSTLGWLTTFGPSPWAVSLLAAVQNSAQLEWLLAGPGPGSTEDRLGCLLAIGMKISNLDLQNVLYGFGPDARRALKWAAAAGGTDEQARTALQGWSEGIDWSPADALSLALDGLSEQPAEIQLWVCHSIRQRVATAQVDLKDLWTIVSNSEWRESKWQELGDAAFQALGCAIIDAALRESPDWTVQIPHLFADIAERLDDKEERHLARFRILLRACAATNAPSSLIRLLRGRSGHRYRPLASIVRQNLVQILPEAGGWAAGRLRSLIVHLG